MQLADLNLIEMIRLLLKLVFTIFAINSNGQQLFVECSNDILLYKIISDVQYFLFNGGFTTKYPSLSLDTINQMILAYIEQESDHYPTETNVDIKTLDRIRNDVLSNTILPFIATEHIMSEYQTKHDISSSGYTIKPINRSHAVYMDAVRRLSSTDEEYDQHFNGLLDFCLFGYYDTFRGFGIFLNAADQMIGMILFSQDTTVKNLTQKLKFFESDFEPLDQLQMPIHFVYFHQISVVKNYHGNKLSSKLIQTAFEQFTDDTIFGLHVETTNFVAINCYLKHGFMPVRLVHNLYGLNRHGYVMVRIPSVLVNEMYNDNDVVATPQFSSSLKYQNVAD